MLDCTLVYKGDQAECYAADWLGGLEVKLLHRRVCLFNFNS